MMLSLSNMVSEESGRMTFDATISTLVELNFEQQLWKSGFRLLSTETRARATAGVRLQCEATNRFEFKPGTVVPELVVRFRVTHADVFVDRIIVERTLGMNGLPARTIGETVQKLVKRFQPDLERQLLNRANEAVLKAADTKEIRIGFQKHFLASETMMVSEPAEPAGKWLLRSGPAYGCAGNDRSDDIQRCTDDVSNRRGSRRLGIVNGGR